jgi:hypothetical protein
MRQTYSLLFYKAGLIIITTAVQTVQRRYRLAEGTEMHFAKGGIFEQIQSN